MIGDPRLQEALRQHQAGRLDQAAQLYSAVLASTPRNVQALYLLGFIHFQQERFLEAERLIGQAIALNPAMPDAFYNRGCALQKLRRDDEAVAAFDGALRLKPNYSEALFNRGTSLLKLGRHEAALASFDGSLRLTPGDAEAWHNRGHALQGLRRFAEARDSYAKALTLAPHLPFTRGKLLYCKLQLCDWTDLSREIADTEQGVEAGERVAGPLEHVLISSSPETLLKSARIWTAYESPASPSPVWRGERYTHERIRIAYLSPDFRTHAVAYQIAGVIERHDRTRFDIQAISYGPDDGSAIRARLKNAVDQFSDVRGKSDREVAALLRAAEIDIAIDLSGHTMDSRLGIFAQRAAPLQVEYLGYPGTTGADYMDYIIADPVLIPEEERPAYSEKVVTLPDTFFPTDATREIAEPPPKRASQGLPESGFVFCCFNALCKILPDVFARWMRLLRALDGSVLWLPSADAEAKSRLQTAASAHGVAAERLVFASYLPKADEHLARLPLADLFLDTLPYNAHATANDALWMGVPVVTQSGGTFAGRVASSLLHALGLPELIAKTAEEYESIALTLARDGDALSHLRGKLARNRTTAPLFDTARYCRHLEAAFIAMWERQQRGEAPAHYAVGSQPVLTPPSGPGSSS